MGWWWAGIGSIGVVTSLVLFAFFLLLHLFLSVGKNLYNNEHVAIKLVSAFLFV